MDLNVGIKLHNNFEIVARDITTGTEIKGKAENIVLDRFYYHAIASTSGTGLGTTHIGSSTTAPSADQTALGNQLLTRSNAGSWNTSEFKVGGTGILKYTGSIRIEASELVGSTIAEVGLGGTNGLLTRALLQDANGNPLVITKTNTMIIDVYATAFLTIPKLISGYKLTSRVVPFAFLYYLSNGNAIAFHTKRTGKDWSENLPATLKAPPTQTFSASQTLDAPNLKRNYSLASINATSGNIGGIRSVHLMHSSDRGIEIPVPNDVVVQPVLTKEVVGTGDGTKTAFSTKFGWVRDNGTAKVYVNDVEQTSGVTIKYNIPPKNHAAYYLESTGVPVSGDGGAGLVWENASGAKLVSAKRSGGITGNVRTADAPEGPYTTAVANMASGVWLPIPPEHQSKRYWAGGWWHDSDMDYEFESDIQFDTPPASGATIAVTYQPDCIAKDDTRIINNLSYSLGL